ncbi:MAG TPA: DUF1566 domain-containing protein [Rhodocyclaceae bacterium]|nr:DUF1566 domain-containing protein [Rhodocyclaceae bacterium]
MLRIATQPGGAEVYIGGRHQGTTPAEAGKTLAIRLPGGQYDIEAHKAVDAYREYRGQLQYRHDDARPAPPVELVLDLRLTAAGEQQQADEARRLEAHRRAALERFVPNDDGTVTDTRLGLVWMRCSLGQTWTGDGCAGEARQLNWDQALKAAEDFSHAGVAGWRLPTQPELHSITHCSTGRRFEPGADGMGGGCAGEYQRPTILDTIFPDTPAANFWTSTPHERFSFSAWGVSFHSGHTGTGGRSDYVHVRLVRDAD